MSMMVLLALRPVALAGLLLYGAGGLALGTPAARAIGAGSSGPGQSAPTPAPPLLHDARYFPETGFRIDRDPFWDSFNARGGVDTFGFPVSRAFTFLGCTTQFLQRQLLQQCAGGPVRMMNLLDPDLMPFTQINGSVFPAHDPAVAAQAPAPDTPNYGTAVLAYLQAAVSEEFEGLPVQFFSTWLGAAPPEAGIPERRALLSLELWGFPTSRPQVDPGNHNFVYQRFQRGILLADAFKSLPPDLAAQATGSRFFGQYCPGSTPQWVCRPPELPATDLTLAFEVPLAVATARSVPADGGYVLSVYYTPLEQNHPGGNPVTVPGIGTYPGDFVDKVVQEGNGKTRTGAYLNWAGDGGFWLDTAPRGAQGTALVAFQSSASTRMAFGTWFVVTDCGQPRVDDAVCQRLRAATWQIDDRFEDPSIPPNQIDLYLGEEDGPTFESGPW